MQAMGANDTARPLARRPDRAGSPSRAAQLGEGMVTMHNRPSRLRSIRIRILLPVILATAGLVGLGVIQTDDAIAQTRQGDRARVLARASNTVVTLIHELEREYVETNALRHRGGEAGSQLLVAQRARTDTARTRYVIAGRDALDAVPTLGPSLAKAEVFLDRIPAARGSALAAAEGAPQVFNAYNDAAYALLGVADAIPAQLTDPQLVEIARAVVLVAEVEHLAAEQLDVLRRAFTQERLPTGDLVRLARLAGAEGQRISELRRIPGPAAPRYAELVAGPDVETAMEARDRVLSQPASPEALGVDPDVWYVAQSGYLRRLRLMEVELAGQMERASYDVQIAGQRRIALTTGPILLIAVIVLAGSGALAVRTSRRLRQMREAALTVARTELPNAIARVTAATEPAAVRGALQDSSTRFDSMLTTGADEIGELSTAFGAVHRQALRLAADQAMLRMDVEAIFVGLARRGQTLVQRQIQLIDQFGEAEPDPATRTRLLALDHVATRMRRNEENLLVLAGGEPGRRFTAPVPLRRVIRAAAREIEDYQRVDAFDIPAMAISSQAARDVIHLLAELLENATSFSPPHTPVRVSARSIVEGLTITVYDEGIGMPASKAAEANQRLSQPSALTSALVGTMGLLVVGRLAQRHGLQVQLHSTPGGGTAATVTVPEHLLGPAVADDSRKRELAQVGVAQAGAAQVGVVRPTVEFQPAAAELQPAATPVPVRLGASAALPRRDPAPVPDPEHTVEFPHAGALDPERVRARLASLASGMAAARAHVTSQQGPEHT